FRLLLICPAPPAPLSFPYTTLFRSQNNRTAIFEEGKGLLHRKEQPFYVHVEGLIEMSFGSCRERCDCPRARVREEDVDVTMFLLDRKSTRLNSSHVKSSFAVFCLKH